MNPFVSEAQRRAAWEQYYAQQAMQQQQQQHQARPPQFFRPPPNMVPQPQLNVTAHPQYQQYYQHYQQQILRQQQQWQRNNFHQNQFTAPVMQPPPPNAYNKAAGVSTDPSTGTRTQLPQRNAATTASTIKCNLQQATEKKSVLTQQPAQQGIGKVPHLPT